MAERRSAKPAKEPAGTSKELTLPVSVVGPTDVGRLIRELEAIDDAILQLNLRKEGAPETKLPKTSKLMDQIVHVNRLNLLKRHGQGWLETIPGRGQRSSRRSCISASVPTRRQRFLDKLMSWLRREIHPSVLLTIGLQPNIGAGCIVRTTNKQFDFSLRQDFANKRDLLLRQIAGDAGRAGST